MGRATDLMIYKKTRDLYTHCRPIIINYPKAEKFALSQDTKQTFYYLMKSIVLANNVKHKRKSYQDEVEGGLAFIIVLFDLAKESGYITKKSNLYIQDKISEIGRMLGGWIKSNNKV